MLGVEEEGGKDERLESGIFRVEARGVRVLGWTRGVGDWNEIPDLLIQALFIIDAVQTKRV